MATIIEENWGSPTGAAAGRTPDTVDNGNTWSQVGDDATIAVGFSGTLGGFVGQTNAGTGTGSDVRFNPLVVDCGSANVVVTAEVWDNSTGVTNDGPGVALRTTDQDNMIAVRISSEDDIFLMEKRLTATDRATITSDAVTIDQNTVYTIVVTANGSSITAELYDDTDTLISTLSATETDHQSVTNHGIVFGIPTGNAQRCMYVKVEDAITLDPTVDENGFDITVNATSTSTSNYEVKINGGSAINPASVRRIPGTNRARLRMANANRILSTDTLTVTDTAGGFTDEAATNNSEQTTTSIYYNGFRWAFASAPSVGISRSGRPFYAGSNHPTGVTYEPGTGEEQYTIHGSMLNPPCNPTAETAFHPDAPGYNAATAINWGTVSITRGDSIVSAAAAPALVDHLANTAYSVGDCINPGSFRLFRVVQAGTTGDPKASISDQEEVTDGTVIFRRAGANGTVGDGRSLVRRVGILTYCGDTLEDQDTFCPPHTEGSTKKFWTWSEVSAAVAALRSDDNGYTDVAAGELVTKWPWYDRGRPNFSARTSPEDHYRIYSQDTLDDSVNALAALVGQGNFKDNLIDQCIQIGIDQIGWRESGGFWAEDGGGWDQGRIAFGLFFAGLVYGDDPTQLATLKQTDWSGTELAYQVFYVESADLTRALDSAFEYNPSSLDTYVNPTTAPSTYSDQPANAYFPASVRGSWLHTPEWGLRHATEPERDTPLWFYNDVEAYYRRCCTAIGWGSLCYIMDLTGIVEAADAEAFEDYVRRYEHIQGPDGANGNWRYDDLWTLFEANEDTFTFTASAVIVGGTWYIDLNFNRYATQTDANIASQFGCSGSISLSNADQTGPRTFRVQASADPRGETITYTESGTAANRVVDSGDNELPTASTATVIGTQELQLTINPTTTPTIVASGGKLDFGKVAKGTLAARSIEIENTGDATLKLDLNTATITSTDVVNYFAKGSGSWNDDEDVAPDGTLQLAVTFNAAAATLSPGTYTAVLSIPSNDADSPFTLNLSATVLEVGPSTKGNWGINTAIKIGV